MTDHDTLELRRMVADEPVHPGQPDLTALVASGRRIRTRRRAVAGGVALGTGAALATPVLLLALSGPGGGPTRESLPVATEAAATCGVLSCVSPDGSSRETGEVVGELEVGPLAGGATELVYVARQPGAGEWEGQTVDVLSAGYRLDGQLRRTAWALQPGSDGPRAPRFWGSAGPANARPGEHDHYAVLGYVDGSPDEITWSTPDGATGAVDGVLRLDGYTVFYVSQPMPEGAGEAPRPKREGELITLAELSGDTVLAPELTISTSDGWSCSFEDCGTTG